MSMRIKLAGACLALAAVSFIAGAHAQTLYIGGEGGWANLQDQRDKLGIARAPNLRSQFSDGYAVGAKIGYEMGPWRLEEEYQYRFNDLNRIRAGGFTVPGARGHREAHAAMTNLLYDFNMPTFGIPVTPHVGAGVGAVNLVERARVPAGRLLRGDDWVFGYQAIAGVRYNMTPNLALDLDYRYLATTDATFRLAAAPAVRYKSGYESHNLMASLVYRFGAPAPLPPPVAAPLPPAPPPVSRRVFLVFFDWDRATITSDGMAVIQQAADAYRAGGRVQIQVTGYTDRSGSPGYNQRLSERRANAVAGALARLGVARNDMAVGGRGENDNRVPTADGVREPQNRRVEIVFP